MVASDHNRPVNVTENRYLGDEILAFMCAYKLNDEIFIHVLYGLNVLLIE